MRNMAKIPLFIALFWGIAFILSQNDHKAPTMAPDTVLAATLPTEAVSATTTAILALTNRDRGTPLHVDAALMIDAQSRASYFCNHPFEHYSAEGITPWMFFQGYNYVHAGENLGQGYATPEILEEAFMNSPEHRSNITNPNYTDVGVGWMCGVTVVLFGNK